MEAAPRSPVLVDLLATDAVPWETLHARYGSLLQLVHALLGVVPNCDPYLEIWPPAFRSYNVIVPNLLNLPFLIWGVGAPRATVGLAMYVSSRSAGCAYCSAHSCTFALRRGAKVDDVASALGGGSLSAADRAAVAVARALSVVPAALRDEDRAELLRCFSPAHAEWLVLAVGLMGWLNKTMDGLGIPLEEPTVAEVNGVISASGWTPGRHLRGDAPPDTAAPRADSLGKRLGVIRHAPAAMKFDKDSTRGVPDRWPAVGAYLREKTGHDFPVLSRLRHRRAIRGIATAIKDNFGESIVGRGEKLAAGLVYAQTVGNSALAGELRAAGATEVAESAVQKLARAVSPSPAVVDGAVIDACRDLAPAAIVEVVTFIALLQLLHRLMTYYPS